MVLWYMFIYLGATDITYKYLPSCWLTWCWFAVHWCTSGNLLASLWCGQKWTPGSVGWRPPLSGRPMSLLPPHSPPESGPFYTSWSVLIMSVQNENCMKLQVLWPVSYKYLLFPTSLYSVKIHFIEYLDDLNYRASL